MKPFVIVVLAVAGMALAHPGQADHGCNGTVIEIDAGSETFYLDDRGALGETNHWLYVETNSIEGLQSGGWVDVLQEPIEPSFPDPCSHRNPDALMIMISP